MSTEYLTVSSEGVMGMCRINWLSKPPRVVMRARNLAFYNWIKSVWLPLQKQK